jgi:hypothetical protein
MRADLSFQIAANFTMADDFSMIRKGQRLGIPLPNLHGQVWLYGSR